MKTKHRYGSRELCARLQHPAAAGSGAGGGRGGGEWKQPQPCQRRSGDVGLGAGELQLHSALSYGRGCFFFPPLLASEGWEVGALMWCWRRDFTEHPGLRLSTKNWARGQKPAAPRRSHGCKDRNACEYLPAEIWNKKKPFWLTGTPLLRAVPSPFRVAGGFGELFVSSPSSGTAPSSQHPSCVRGAGPKPITSLLARSLGASTKPPKSPRGRDRRLPAPQKVSTSGERLWEGPSPAVPKQRASFPGFPAVSASFDAI